MKKTTATNMNKMIAALTNVAITVTTVPLTSFDALLEDENEHDCDDPCDDIYACDVCGFEGDLAATLRCERSHTEDVRTVQHKASAQQSQATNTTLPLRLAWGQWYELARQERVLQAALTRALNRSAREAREEELSSSLRAAKVRALERRRPVTGHGVGGLQRRLERPEFDACCAAVVSMTQAKQKYEPRAKQSSIQVCLKGGRMNNERGDGCRGQGKRHQNAAVHSQPRKAGGRLAKWSSNGGTKKSKTKKAGKGKEK